MKKLTTMTDFVIDRFNERNEDYDILVYNYANFLKQPLELWMFVPCDEDGNVLEEKSMFNTNDEDYIFYSDDFDKHQQAKERCLFDGFVIKDCLLINKKNILVINYLSDKTIEHIVNNEIELTETAIKQIGL